MKYELGEILFERDFESLDADGNVTPIKLQVSKPQLDAEKSLVNEPVWFCTHRILGVGHERVFPSWGGEDALEALMCSLEMAGTMLELERSKHITWLGSDDLRLPKMKPSEVKDEHSSEFSGFEEIFEEFFRNIKGKKSDR